MSWKALLLLLLLLLLCVNLTNCLLCGNGTTCHAASFVSHVSIQGVSFQARPSATSALSTVLPRDTREESDKHSIQGRLMPA